VPNSFIEMNLVKTMCYAAGSFLKKRVVEREMVKRPSLFGDLTKCGVYDYIKIFICRKIFSSLKAGELTVSVLPYSYV
jgi:hypothetical protein